MYFWPFLHAGFETHCQLEKALENFLSTSICSSIYLLSVHSVLWECLLTVNICQLVQETHLRSEKAKFQGFSTTSVVQICRGKQLRDGPLNFHRRDSWYLLWFELELQKHHFPPLLAPLTLHATPLLFCIFTIPTIKMPPPPVRLFSPRKRHSRTVAKTLDGTSLCWARQPLQTCTLQPEVKLVMSQHVIAVLNSARLGSTIVNEQEQKVAK